MKVGYQGNHATFSEIAVIRYFANQQIEKKGYKNFPSILQDVKDGVLDYAVLPVENTTTGIIARTYDLFAKYGVYAVGEVNVEIREDLIGVPGARISEIKEVYSHPEALSQCTGLFEKYPNMKPMAYQDTAQSVAYIKECNDPTKAALASYLAREYYNMETLLPEVQDSKTNMTRFLVVTNHEEVTVDANKISMMFVAKHRPGALYNIIGILAKNGIDIVRLESRPIPGKIFEYLFYIDFTGNTKDREIQRVLKELQLRCEESVILGCYKAAR